jgi:hypothetical protein
MTIQKEETKKIVDIRTSLLNGKMVRTTHYSDGSKITGIVSEKQITRLVDRIEKIPDLKVVKGFKSERGSGGLDVFLVICLAGFLIAILSGARPNNLNEECTGRSWFKSEDCRRYYSHN